MFKVKELDAPSAECSLCKYIIAYVDAVIQTNKSEAAIDSALEKVCTILPHALNSSCVQFVETYGPVVVELLAKYATPDEVCVALKLCHNGTQGIPTRK
jgi:saposin